MMGRNVDLAAARDRALGARARFQAALGTTKARIAPARLKEDAIIAVSDKMTGARDAMQGTFRRHPVIVSSLAAGLVTVLFRRPAAMLARAGWRSSKGLRARMKKWRQSGEG